MRLLYFPAGISMLVKGLNIRRPGKLSSIRF